MKSFLHTIRTSLLRILITACIVPVLYATHSKSLRNNEALTIAVAAEMPSIMTRNHRMAAATAVTLAVFIKLYYNNSTSPAAGPAEVVTLSISDQEKYGMLTPKLGVGEPM